MIVLAATFVAEPIEAPLALALESCGIREELAFAPYHQVFQELLDPSSALGRNTQGTSILLLRVEDFAREQKDHVGSATILERGTQDLVSALAAFSQRLSGNLILGILPPSPMAIGQHGDLLQQLGTQIETQSRDLRGVQLLLPARIAAVAGPAESWHDEIRDQLAHIPYTDTHYAALALACARLVHTLRCPASKVLVLDCDNTIWRGVVGEDGVEGVVLDPAALALQQFAIDRQAEGVLICLASKNSEADVYEVFARRSDMRLQLSHIVAHRINWQPKAVNLQSLASELNLGLDAFVFLDDNPLECGQMRAELPEVITLPVPQTQPEVAAMLANLWVFDKLAVTSEDAQRTRMYRENSARRALESSVSDIGQFMEALELRTDIAHPAEDEWARIEQLAQRTNQFNFTTRRYSAAQLRAMTGDGAVLGRVRVSDRFGDYGLVGVVLAVVRGRDLEAELFLLSCRVLGRGVEHRMLSWLGSQARALGCAGVVLPFIQTARNEPARAFAESVALAPAVGMADMQRYHWTSEAAEAVQHRPGHDPEAVIEARLADERKGSARQPAVPAAQGRSERYQDLATRFGSGAALHAALLLQRRTVRQLPGDAVPPDSDLERRLHAVWEEVLGVDGIGVEDDYFALGGTSLLSVQLFAAIRERFGVDLRLTAILEAPSIRALTRMLAPGPAEQRDALVVLRDGGPRTLFLVHDGLGETLLYLNLARRLPAGLKVVGIEPVRLPGIPMAHASIEHMARDYVDRIRQSQVEGPYLLGGMCAGGVIAYQMAAELARLGQGVEGVFILDGATPQAPRREGRIRQQRLTRMHGLLGRGSGSPLALAATALTLLRKARNVVVYETTAALERGFAQWRFRQLRTCLERGQAWPSWLRPLSVAQIYSALEAAYQPPPLPDVPVILVRATQGEGADTPYRDLYQGEAFGWDAVAHRLRVIDVSGGHASMLQEDHVDALHAAVVGTLASVAALPDRPRFVATS